MADQSPFEKLGEMPTIGEISFARNGERNNLLRAGIPHGEFGRQTWVRYNNRFGTRPDYQLYTLLVRSKYNSSPPSKDQLGTLVKDGLRSEILEVQWGVLTVLAYVADGWATNNYYKHLVANLGLAEFAPLVRDLQPIAGASAACEVIREVLLHLVFCAKFNVEARGVETHTNTGRLDWCIEWLTQFALDWTIGNRIYIDFARLDSRVVAVGNKVVHQSLVLTTVVERLRQCRIKLEILDVWDATTETMARTGYQLANNVWNCSRHSLCGELRYRLNNRKPRPGNLNLQNLSDKHARALNELVLYASYCGEHLRCAALAHLYLKTIRDPAMTSHFADQFGGRIRQAGLQVDERRRDDEFQQRIRPARLPRARDPYERAIKRDQSCDPRWKTLSENFDVWEPIVSNGEARREGALSYDGIDTLRYLARAAKDKILIHQVVVRAAYRLALNYSFMNWASKFLGSLQATRQDLLDFAHHLKRFQQVMPFGIDRTTQELWQRQLKECWFSLPDTELPNGSEQLVLHEVLLGRSLQMVRNADGETARLIALAHNDLVSESDSRLAAIREPSLAAQGPAIVMPIKVANFLHDFSRSEIGAPVCISIVRLESDRLHLLACGCDCEGQVRWVSEQVNGEGETSVNGLSERLGRLKQTCRDWLEPNENGLDELHIDWGTPFENLCLRISALAKGLSADCRWLMLAVDADLAPLPWQDLFRRFWNGRKPVLVSLVPSFGWAILCHERECAYPDNYRRELSTATDLARLQARLPDLTTLRFRIRDAFQAAPWLFNETAIIAGHGKTSESGFPLIEVADGILSEEDWIELSDYRIVVLHSCFGGHVTPGYLGDLGGLIGLTLGGQTKLLCAPVAEVPVEAAIKLHEHHGKADGPREFGLRYLNALKENHAVGLYNLYGLPTERVGKTNRAQTLDSTDDRGQYAQEYHAVVQ